MDRNDWQSDVPRPQRGFLVNVFLWGLAALLILGIYTLIWGVPSLFANREVQKFNAETTTQVYENSRSYQQGTQLDLARYCTTWRTTPDGPARTAVANLYSETLATYNGPTSAMVEQCTRDMGIAR